MSSNHSPLHLLHRLCQFADELFAARVRHMTPSQYAILATIANEKGLSQADIVEHTGIDR